MGHLGGHWRHLKMGMRGRRQFGNYEPYRHFNSDFQWSGEFKKRHQMVSMATIAIQVTDNTINYQFLWRFRK